MKYLSSSLPLRILLYLTGAVSVAFALLNLPARHPFSLFSYLYSTFALAVFVYRVCLFLREKWKVFLRTTALGRIIAVPEQRAFLLLVYSTVVNGLYGLFLFLEHSVWGFSLGLYYILLAIARFIILRHMRAGAENRGSRDDILVYIRTGAVLLVLNLALAFMTYLITFEHAGNLKGLNSLILTALFSFTKLISAVVLIIRRRRRLTWQESASAAVKLAAALVSMFTLQASFLALLEDDPSFTLFMNGLVGNIVFALILIESLFMIIHGSKVYRSFSG